MLTHKQLIASAVGSLLRPGESPLQPANATTVVTAQDWTQRHPQYSAAVEDWELMRDCLAGSRTVKAAGAKYLPYTSAMRAAGAGAVTATATTEGVVEFNAYKLRAIFPEVTEQTSNELVGHMHRAAATIELPPKLEALRERATPQGEGMGALLRRINLHQLAYGRIALVLDVDAATNLPYIATYSALAAINWDDTPPSDSRTIQRETVFAVFDESGKRREGTVWKDERRFRVCQRDAAGNYETFTVVNGSEGAHVVPGIQGRTLDRVPVIFAAATDTDPSVGPIPLLPLANLALGIYRGDADYRHTLFMTAQETLVIIGAGTAGPDEDGKGGEGAASPQQNIGASALINIPEAGPGVDVKYVGISGAGLEQQAKALESLEKRANEYGARMVTPGKAAESGEALQIRTASRTASLTTVAKTGAMALETILKVAALWVGDDPNKVKVDPNLDFVDEILTGTELGALMGARRMGAPLSIQSIHEMMRRREMTQLSYEDEVALIEEEGDGVLAAMGLGDKQPPEDDEGGED